MGGLVGQQLPAAGDGGDGTPDQAVGGDTQEGVDVGVDDSSPEETVNISNVGEGVVGDAQLGELGPGGWQHGVGEQVGGGPLAVLDQGLAAVGGDGGLPVGSGGVGQGQDQGASVNSATAWGEVQVDSSHVPGVVEGGFEEECVSLGAHPHGA